MLNLHKKTKFFCAGLSALILPLLLLPQQVLAAINLDPSQVTSAMDGIGGGAYGKIGSYFLGGIFCIGVVLVTFGAVKSGMGFKDEDSAAKIQGMQSVIAGALLAAISLVTGVFGSATRRIAEIEGVGETISLLSQGITYLGVATLVFGAVQAGAGFKNDDADGKVKGMRTVIAGAIVFAVGQAAAAASGT
ncbi:MAG: hypothetical protein LBM38_01130 [Clostridiales bacterium]|jgi:hypothetical protein|nr:hypothetical protein [Clostridiales bacterium]